VVDLFDAHSLTCERSAEIDFLFVNADSSAAGDKSCPIVEGIGKLSDAALGSRGGLVDFGRIFHLESFMKFEPAGRVASIFKVRCMRSWRPFY
jgi:hypothetical protein